MPTILICGDPHGSYQHINAAAHEMRPDAVILLGDLELPAPATDVFKSISDLTEIRWIPGNHDSDCVEYFDNLFSNEFVEHCLHGAIVDLCGVRVAGLGGVFRSKVWDGGSTHRYWSQADMLERCGKGNRWRNGVPMRHRTTIFPLDVEKLLAGKADVLVTHEAPSFHPFGYEVLDDLALSLGVRHAFHGHHHESIKYPGSCWHGVGFRHTVLLGL